MTYLAVFDRAKTDWSLSRADLIDALARSWPDLRPTAGPAADPARDVVWTYSSDDGELEAYAHKSGTCLYIDGNLKGAARFATWYRSLVPPSISLIFCDDSYSFNTSIDPGMTSAELVEVVHTLVGP